MKLRLYSSFFYLIFLSMPLFSEEVTPIAGGSPVHEAFISKSSEISLLAAAPLAPPAPFNESVPPQPEGDLLWIPGYWEWNADTSSYHWVCGVWRRPPPNMQWIPGEFVTLDEGWVRLEGFWSKVPLTELPPIAKAPPAFPLENIPPSPGDNYFWIKGYWDYQQASSEYRFLEGSWQPFDAEWIYTPAKYVWRPSGYLFIAPFWDYPLDKRGYSYKCEGNQESMEPIQPEIWIRELYIVYPDYIPIYWHWWHFHPGFWDDCWCFVPWWRWHNWWALGWHDHWAIWWWWGHPGFPAPVWMDEHLARMIHAPDAHALQFFKKNAPPPFITPKGIPPIHDWLGKLRKPILPKNVKERDKVRDSIANQLPKGPEVKPEGKKGIKTAPLPKFPDIRPIPPGSGKVNLPGKPHLPPKVSLPPKPKLPMPPPQQTQQLDNTPPQPSPHLPSRPSRPENLPSVQPVPPRPDRPQYTPPPPPQGAPTPEIVPPPQPMPPRHERPQYTPPQDNSPNIPPQPMPPRHERPQYTPPQDNSPNIPPQPMPRAPKSPNIDNPPNIPAPLPSPQGAQPDKRPPQMDAPGPSRGNFRDEFRRQRDKD